VSAQEVVVVTEPEYRKAEDAFLAAAGRGLRCLCAPHPEEQLAGVVREHGARHAILGVEKYEEELYAALPAGGVLARFGVGFDGLDLARATAAGLYCTNTPGVLDRSVAEHTLALMLAAARNVCGRENRVVGAELAGLKLAVIGCGAIGCRVAAIASRGLGMNVTGCEVRDLDVAAMKREHGFGDVVEEFEEAVDGADFVSLHLPLVDATRGFLNASRIAAIPPGAWLLNTARGGLVDEEALHAALSTGQLAGAALDVTVHEPYEPVAAGADLRELPNTIMTPHVGSSTVQACRRMAARSLENVLLARSGEHSQMDLLNPEVLEHRIEEKRT